MVRIAEARFDDPVHCAGIVEVLNAYAGDPMGGGEPLAADVRERLVPRLRTQPTVLVLLAFADERPVGVAVCFWGFSTFQARPLLNVHDLAVLPEYRGRRIGRALLEAAEARARARDCCKLGRMPLRQWMPPCPTRDARPCSSPRALSNYYGVPFNKNALFRQSRPQRSGIPRPE